MNQINWGIIGVGNVTEVKSGPAFNKVPHSNLLMVMRRDLAKAKDYADRHGVPAYTNRADDLLKHPDINAIYIATPPSTHAEYCIQAAKAGKHVYVEKPMAISHRQCLEMIETCQKNGVKLFVAYYRRELEYFKKIKELVNTEIIGEVKSIEVKLFLPPYPEDANDQKPWRVIPEIAGAGYFYDLASHQFDFLDYAFGPITSVSGHTANQSKLYNAEDAVSASFFINPDIVGTGSWNFTVLPENEIDQTIIYGTQGKMIFSFFTPHPIQVVIGKKSISFPIEYPAHVQLPLIETVVADLLGNGLCASTGISAARTNWVMDRILGKDLSR